MADINGYTTGLLAGIGFSTSDGYSAFPCRFPSTNYIYQMEGIGASGTGTCSWVVQGSPDFTAATPSAAAAIASAGLSTPLRLVRIVSTWAAPQ